MARTTRFSSSTTTTRGECISDVHGIEDVTQTHIVKSRWEEMSLDEYLEMLEVCMEDLISATGD